jgi:hypothetical protein
LAELKPLTQARDDLQGSLEGGRQKEVEATRARSRRWGATSAPAVNAP